MADDKHGAKISIVTVCFNSAATIRDTLESIATQSYKNIEYIIVDGGSKDTTLDIIKEYSHIVDQLITEPDDGIYDAMSKGVAYASGDVIGILNSDDFFEHENVLREVNDVFSSNSNASMIFGEVAFVQPEDLTKVVRYYSSWFFKSWMLRFGYMPAHPATFVKKSAYDDVGYYKKDYKIAGDFEFFVRSLLVKGHSYAKVKSCFVRMRNGGVSTSGLRGNWVSSLEMVKALKDNKVYSNVSLVSLRLPIKLLQLIRL